MISYSKSKKEAIYMITLVQGGAGLGPYK